MLESIELDLYRVLLDDTGKTSTIILQEMEGDKFLPIYIGLAEAKSIQQAAINCEPGRPLTHDLMVDMIERTNIEILSVHITKIVDSTFYADINLRHSDRDEVITLDARPSDALAIAIRSGCSIYCSPAIMDEASITCQN